MQDLTLSNMMLKIAILGLMIFSILVNFDFKFVRIVIGS